MRSRVLLVLGFAMAMSTAQAQFTQYGVPLPGDALGEREIVILQV